MIDEHVARRARRAGTRGAARGAACRSRRPSSTSPQRASPPSSGLPAPAGLLLDRASSRRRRRLGRPGVMCHAPPGAVRRRPELAPQTEVRALLRRRRGRSARRGAPVGADVTLPAGSARLVAIGVAAGVFSASFGVGGGISRSPPRPGRPSGEREATATSLGAIGITALAGVVVLRSAARSTSATRRSSASPPPSGRSPARLSSSGAHEHGRVRVRAPLVAVGVFARDVSTSTILPDRARPHGGRSRRDVRGGRRDPSFPPSFLLGLGQLEAQGDLALAILPTVAAGAWNQRRYVPLARAPRWWSGSPRSSA
jgi:hypothetical protein